MEGERGRTTGESDATPAKVRLGTDVFNRALLKYFYQNLFPFKQMFQWLSYGNGACARTRAGAARRGGRPRHRPARALRCRPRLTLTPSSPPHDSPPQTR